MEFSDGAVKLYPANIITENILNQFNEYRYHNQLINTTLEHSKNSRAIENKNKWIITKRGRKSMRKTTVVWKFRVKWKYGTITWKPLKELKESNQIEMAEYVSTQGIQDNP